jgi:hypothetical protein
VLTQGVKSPHLEKSLIGSPRTTELVQISEQIPQQ